MFLRPKSRKARVFLAILALAAGGFLILFFTSPTPGTNLADTSNAEKKAQETYKNFFSGELSKDTDGDGLMDWEEAIYKTDPNNPDTDGDGTSDGDEIKQNRNPLVKGPNDTTTPIASESPAEFHFDNKNLTHLFTEKLSGNSGFLDILKTGSGSINPNAIATYAKSLPLGELAAPIFDEKNLTIIDDASEAAIEQYFNEFADIYLRYGDAFSKAEFEIAEEAFSSGDMKKLALLSIQTEALANITRDANKLSIPKSLVWFHKQEITLLEKSKNEISLLQKADTDPLGALIALGKRIETRQALTDLHASLGAWLSERKIPLSFKAKAFFIIN